MTGTLPRRVEKPWGHEIIFAHTERYVGKILHLEKGHKLSRQFHRVKDESLTVLHGILGLELGAPPDVERRLVREGDVFHIPPLTVHRFVAVESCDLIEVSTPELDDVVRLEDEYGRAGTSDP
ncbi:MAG: cupin [Deltaproteobacteria bacterium]|nr:cupin [Deltaproteobacteria bacterium]